MSVSVVRLVGVYNADGGLLGELRYAAGKLFGTAECALCDITHKGIAEKSEMAACRRRLDVPFETVHLNERDRPLRDLTDGRTPCVVAVDSVGGMSVLLSPDELAECAGSVESFETEILQRLGAIDP